MDNYETAKQYMQETQQKYVDFGALDTEPREIILTRLREAFDATDTTRDTTISERTGTSDERGEPSVVGGRGTGSRDTDTEITTPPDDGTVGRSELPVDDTTAPSPDQSDTVAEETRAKIAKQLFDSEMAEIRARNKSMLDGIDEITAEDEAKIA